MTGGVPRLSLWSISQSTGTPGEWSLVGDKTGSDSKTGVIPTGLHPSGIEPLPFRTPGTGRVLARGDRTVHRTLNGTSMAPGRTRPQSRTGDG